MQQYTPKTKIITLAAVLGLSLVFIFADISVPFWQGAFYALFGASAMGLFIETTRFLVSRKKK